MLWPLPLLSMVSLRGGEGDEERDDDVEKLDGGLVDLIQVVEVDVPTLWCCLRETGSGTRWLTISV